jgi:hypothetical protein
MDTLPPGELTLLGDTYSRAIDKFPDGRGDLNHKARHCFDRAIRVMHQQNRPAQFEQGKLLMLLLATNNPELRRRAWKSVDDELKWAKSRNNLSAARKARVDMLAFYLLADDKREFLKYRQSLIDGGNSLENIEEIAKASLQENPLLIRVYKEYPGFPYEPAK